MPKSPIMKFVSKEEKARQRAESRAAFLKFKSQFKPATEQTVYDDYSDYVHPSMTSLHKSSQDAIISLMREIKEIGDATTKYLDFAYGVINSRVFFCYPVEPFDLLGSISSYQLVAYKAESEANAYSDALYWPGGGNLVAEYRNTTSLRGEFTVSDIWNYPEAWMEISDRLTKHMENWLQETSEEDISTKHDPSDDYRWMIAVHKKNVEFMSKLNHIKAALPEIAIAMKEWAESRAEQIIEREQYEEEQSIEYEREDFEYIDTSVIDPE
jgi:hypothetical protein